MVPLKRKTGRGVNHYDALVATKEIKYNKKPMFAVPMSYNIPKNSLFRFVGKCVAKYFDTTVFDVDKLQEIATYNSIQRDAFSRSLFLIESLSSQVLRSKKSLR